MGRRPSLDSTTRGHLAEMRSQQSQASHMKRLRVATCQFSVEPKIAHNRKYVLAQIDQAADGGADVVHFSECALSGYAGIDFPDIAALDFDELRAATQDVMAAA